VDLIGVTEVGRVLGASKQRAHQLSQVPGFPKPATTLATGRVWRRADVERWARKAGRLK
jgi:prophage regulatory protein